MHASTSRGIPSDPAIPPGARSGCGFIRATAPFVNWHPRLLTCACIELQLQRELDVVCVRTVHVVLEGVVQDRELSDPGHLYTTTGTARRSVDERLAHT